MATGIQTGTIPLQCTLCPKAPTFSDVSHLLTHISSKGHLSCYFRTKVRANNDPEIKKLVDDFDHWYTFWGIDNMMADRLNLKDKKNKQKAGSSRGNSRSNSLGALNRQANSVNRPTNLARTMSSHQPYAQVHDSQLPMDQTRIKRESSQSPWNTASRPMGQYSPGYNLRESTSNRIVNYADSPFGSDYSQYSGYPEPPRGYGNADQENKNLGNKSSFRKSTKVKSQEDSDDDLPIAEDAEYDARNDTAKLKGVIWPGMDIFDSATPAARRRRNQKKSQTVLQQLEHNSLDVTNFENVWWPNGDLKKSKEISGIPSSSSPVRSPEQRLPVHTTGLTMADFVVHQYQNDSPAPLCFTSGVFDNNGGNTHSSEGRKIKRNFQAYYDGDDVASVSSLNQPMNMSFLTRGMAPHHDTDDIDSRPARRHMRDAGRLDNRPYENLSPSPFGNQRTPGLQGKYTNDQDQNSAFLHVKPVKQEGVSTPNGQVGNFVRPGAGDSALPRTSITPDAGTNGGIRSAVPENLFLRGVGTQFTDQYGNPVTFSGNPASMSYRGHGGHGGHGRRSLGTIPIEELLNSQPTNSQIFMPNGGYQGMHTQNYNYGQHPMAATSMPMASTGASALHNVFDIGQILGFAQQLNANHGMWDGSSNMQNTNEVPLRASNNPNGVIPGIDSANGYQNKPSGVDANVTNQVCQADGKNTCETIVDKTNTNVASTPTATTEDDGRTVTAPGSSPGA